MLHSVRLLCISDVHGHADALGAVLATAERQGYDRLVVLGDLCFPGPKPLETWRRLVQAKAVCVQGSGDRALATVDPSRLRARSDQEQRRIERFTAVQRELGDLILARLARLPHCYRVPIDDDSVLVAVHGSPEDPLESITHDMPDDEIEALLGDESASVVLCGGSHVPFDRVIESGTRIIGVGSVGESLSGDPTSRLGASPTYADAAFIELRGGLVHLQQFVVPLGRAA